jgi:hypothetical protein
VLGLLAGNLASFLRLQPQSTAAHDAPEPLDVPGRLDALNAELARLTEVVERLARQGAEPGTPTDQTDDP